MQMNSIEEAINVFRKTTSEPHALANAQNFILSLDPQVSVPRLLEALLSSHFVIRWEAAELLAQIGCPALHEILKALVDPTRVGNPRFRNGIYHALRANRDKFVREVTAHLLKALHSSVPDLETMVEANHLLLEVQNC